MLTIIMLVLLALVILVFVAWWMFEVELPDVGTAGTAPAAGACIIYWYGSLLAWIISVVLFLAGGGYMIYCWRRDAKPGSDTEPK